MQFGLGAATARGVVLASKIVTAQTLHVIGEALDPTCSDCTGVRSAPGSFLRALDGEITGTAAGINMAFGCFLDTINLVGAFDLDCKCKAYPVEPTHLLPLT